ncbi:glycosyl transferase [uncultured Microbacterium sp.]|uniref:Glycosyltransferase n=1 Tax=uncultured Microbacterium sp. TaxID=191216 RepID=A0A1Y5NW40_9MICO|nr:glycosyl transferase [uncultured Microbacterium sp.]SBS70677.1 Glycosyltransferase [uncultured Microbacterium sp.]
MRFVWAVAAFVLATLMIGAGIAQRTVFQGPETESQAIEIDETAPYILVDGSVLNSHRGAQTFRARGDGEIFAAYGRTNDMTQWLATSDHVRVTLDDDGELSTSFVAAPALPEGEEPAALTPSGSDLWLDEFQQEDVLVTSLQLPEDMSMLVAADGVQPAPSRLTLTWPTGVTTPWAGPLIVGGCIVMAAGIVLYILGLRHARRSRGPRRKGLPLTPTEPIDLAVEGADKGVISATPTRRQLSAGKRAFALVPALAVSALLFTGCTADAWPQLGGTPTPTPSETVIVPDGQGQPAVTETQAQRIVTRIAEQVAKADEAQDADAAATRLAGPALAERRTNYKLRAKLDDQPALDPIPSGALSIVLPQAFDGWPRTFMAVVDDPQDKQSTIMAMSQEDAWADYKLTYIANLAADTSMNVAPAYVGATAVEPNSPFLVLPPDQVAAAYADILNKGDDSEFTSFFDEATDTFRAEVAKDRADRLEQFNKTGQKTGKLSFAATAGEQAPVALATLDSGAIVAVTINESDTVTPTNDDAVIKVDSNPIVKTLAGVTQSATGFTTTFADQLFFFVPAQSSSESIRFLGYSSNILSAKVVKK